MSAWKLLALIDDFDKGGNYIEADRVYSFLLNHNRRIAQIDYSQIDWTDPDAWKLTINNQSQKTNDGLKITNTNELPKNIRKFIELLRSGKYPGEMSRKEFEDIATQLGFDIMDTTKHFAISHPDLVGHPVFKDGVISSLNDHAHGVAGRMHYRAMKDFKDALKYMHPHLF